MSDVRLVNVIPVVNGWKTASLKSKGEAQTLMASGNIPDYNAGLVKNAAADLVAGMAEDLLKAPVIDPETLRPTSEWELNPNKWTCEWFRCKKCHHISCCTDAFCGGCGAKMTNAGAKSAELPIPEEASSKEKTTNQDCDFKEVEWK